VVDLEYKNCSPAEKTEESKKTCDLEMATNNLNSAKAKIALASFPFQDLPANSGSSLWTTMLYNLTIPEASALQNARCVPLAGNLCWFIFVFTSIFLIFNYSLFYSSVPAPVSGRKMSLLIYFFVYHPNSRSHSC
jgi:hypothetical protein